MSVHVRLTGRLSDLVPRGEGEADLDIAGDTLADLVDAIGLEGEEHLLTAVNGTMVPADERAGRLLADGDRVTMMPPVKGG